MDIVMIVSALAAVGIVGYMLIKKADIKLTLMGVGLALLYISIAMGTELVEDVTPILQPFQVVVDQFKSVLPAAGLVILLLGGYTAYMSHIGANDATVHALTRPLRLVKSPWALVPFVFLLGSLLSLVIPSASNLAIILLATLYPVLKAAGMSTLTAAGVIATTATIVPTPLGADNVAIATELAQHPEFAGMTVTDYVFNFHAPVSIPTLLVIAIAHYFWQKFMDKRDIAAGRVSGGELVADEANVISVEGSGLYKAVYATLPLLPILVLVAVYAINAATGSSLSLSVEIAVLVCWVFSLLVHLGFTRKPADLLEGSGKFFKGMGGAFDIVVLLVAASVFVKGLQSIGLLASLQTAMSGADVAGWTLPLIMVGITALIVLLSGSGVALFYAMVPLMYSLAAAAGISALALSIPMGLAGNLMRAVSPVAAVIVIVAGATKESPINIVKRTWFPMIVGVVFMFVFSMIRFL